MWSGRVDGFYEGDEGRVAGDRQVEMVFIKVMRTKIQVIDQ
ncbi:hypothetical protein [Metabacillus malikii]|uniref:Uncharacterized protein n=1 Tax=Metabacillus malikii TaxID=1504265 RepID=A0ABT9ZIB2_9BACI|nr:hypothetical protein [Metabacillus malikii]MDQ0232021.1 hypothetical protein [Metabacillus malikii]